LEKCCQNRHSIGGFQTLIGLRRLGLRSNLPSCYSYTVITFYKTFIIVAQKKNKMQLFLLQTLQLFLGGVAKILSDPGRRLLSFLAALSQSFTFDPDLEV